MTANEITPDPLKAARDALMVATHSTLTGRTFREHDPKGWAQCVEARHAIERFSQRFADVEAALEALVSQVADVAGQVPDQVCEAVIRVVELQAQVDGFGARLYARSRAPELDPQARRDREAAERARAALEPISEPLTEAPVEAAPARSSRPSWRNLTSRDPRKPAAVEAIKAAAKLARPDEDPRKVTCVQVTKDGTRVRGSVMGRGRLPRTFAALGYFEAELPEAAR